LRATTTTGVAVALAGAALLGIAPEVRAQGPERPTLLVLHSYHPGFTWTDKEQRGIERGLRAAQVDVRLQVEYLDAKRHPGAAVRARFEELLVTKLAGERFAAVLATDNAALELALDLRPRLFPGTPVVFCGFNGPPEPVVQGRAGVTGVLERWDPAGTLRAMARLQPGVHDVLVVHDRTESGLGTRADLEAVLPEFSGRFRFTFLPPEPLPATLARLGALPAGWAVLLLGYNVDGAGKVLDSAASGPALAARSAAPVYTMDETRFSGAVLGGSMLTGERQGEAAAELVVRILAGTPAERIPIVRDPVAVLRFDHAALRRFGIPAARLPPGAAVVNAPTSYFRRHPLQAMGLAAFVLALMALSAGLAVNVVHLRRAREALRASEESLRITLDSIGDAVVATGRSGTVANMNPAAEAMTGWRREEAVGRPLAEVLRLVGDDGRAPGSPVEAVVREGRTVALPRPCTLLARDGARRDVADSAAPIRDRDGAVVGAVLVFRDITAERELQEQLRQAQRMEVVGQLAGGVAHDFNNLLTAILGTAHVLVESLPAGSEDRGLADEVVAAALRARDLTRQLLAFSRKGTMQLRPVELHAVIEEALRLLSRSIDKRIEIRRSLDARPDTILGDPALLQSAILNLAVNGRDAMPDGGVLTFATGVVRAPPGEGRDGEELLSVTVGDTGVGMEAAVRSRLFEPYFTTKPSGKGTGLGLASVYGCVKSHRGQIQVESAPGQGSSFRMLFPLYRGEVQVAGPAGEGLVHGHGRILVVDDEEVVRSAVAHMLGSLGYAVETFGEGRAAVERFRRGPAEVDLILLDLVMPQLGGAAVFRLLREVDPGVRVLLVSGFTQHEVTDELLSEGAVGFMHKPFRLDELSRRVAGALASPRGLEAARS
jgi:PAS domain S-box-containing protein